jgi:SAM-dependent methyltransferase/uncharacterized protein YbaR (Trm112 family)
MNNDLYKLIACPGCHGLLKMEDGELVCLSDKCSAQPRRWPIVNNVPVIFDENRSLFRVADLVAGPPQKVRNLRYFLSKGLHFRPLLGRNLAAVRNYREFGKLLNGDGQSQVLVVGCGEGGAGFSQLQNIPNCQFVFADVRWTSIISVLCDGHQLPFPDGLFDGLVIQAVLEHVIDFAEVIQEVTRVLKVGGVVYSECPFLQPIHGSPYDFIRLTNIGHRRAFRNFDEIDSGICGGPGMATAQMLQAATRSFFPGLLWRRFSDWLTDWTLWWLKYLDPLLVRNSAAMDAASGFYFLGRKRSDPISNSMVIESHRGNQ